MCIIVLTSTQKCVEGHHSIFKERGGGVEYFQNKKTPAPLEIEWCPPPLAKWNESGFRSPLCTYRLNWARRTSWGWWDDWDDTVLQTQDSKYEPWRSEAEHATSRSQRLPTILTFTRGWGRNIFWPGTEHRTLAWKAAVLTTTLEPPPLPPSNVGGLSFSLKLPWKRMPGKVRLFWDRLFGTGDIWDTSGAIFDTGF